jgi:hypothetical protein
VEFEELCKDVMQKKTSTSLRAFSKGRDGGIDLTDNTYQHNIIVQVKHYIGSSFANLRTTLKKEIGNALKWRPKQYFVCCGMQLTEANVREIYEMFSSFMESDKNIITLKEIDEFLQEPENIAVVRRHYKLWLYTSNILNEINNQDVFIDCEVLLSDIDEDCKFFVQTQIYNQCIDHLNNNGLLMITGGPGVGKTVTSKMLVLYYASQGYRVRYTTNGDITDIKKSLSNDRDCKEIVLLDDCLGQHYFNMKQTQENELLSLIKYIKLTPNKKLILNSRITIFNEAKERSIEFNKFFQERKIRNYLINMEQITPVEKAKIFYNHLVFKNVPPEYYRSIKENKNYLKIVQHTNYTPRIIEHVTLAANYLQVTASSYFEYVYENLANPNDIWKNEFERRLQNVDRAFISTLYSLTDTSVDYDILRGCFNNRLSKLKSVDYTLDNFDLVVSRLNQSIINIIDYKGNKHIGVINPSVNDYLKIVFAKNQAELNEVRNSICYFSQIERCYSKMELPGIYLTYIVDGGITGIKFSDDHEKNYFITSQICKNNIKKKEYKEYIISYLKNSYFCGLINSEWLAHSQVLERLLLEDFYIFYSISEIIDQRDHIINLLQNLDLDELITTINILNKVYTTGSTNYEWFMLMCKDFLDDAIIDYAENTDPSNYYDNSDIGKLIRDNTRIYYYRGEDEEDLDKEAVITALENKVHENIEKEIHGKLSLLDINIKRRVELPSAFDVSTNDIENAIDSYFRDIDYDDDRDFGSREGFSLSAIEMIFER